MASFALITEGITDQVVIETLLLSCLGQDTVVNPIQPQRDATDESRQAENSFGGWERVLEHCTPKTFAELLSVNDYIVLQLDTDQAEHPNFGLALTENGEDRPVAALIDDVKAVIARKLGTSFTQFAPQILFAIAVHSLECWLLPCYTKVPAAARRSKNCASHLARLRGYKDEKDMKNYREFQQLVAPLQKSKKNTTWQKELQRCREQHPSLAAFLDSLSVIV